MRGVFFLALILLTTFASAERKREPKPEPATSSMVDLFRSRDIVMFGEVHDNRQEYEWLCQLVKSPEFAQRVDDIVVEFGNSLYQKSVDRYIAGETVPLAQVEKAWRNMIGAVGPVSPVYGEFYKAVRTSNLERHGGQRSACYLATPMETGRRSKLVRILALILGIATSGTHRSYRTKCYRSIIAPCSSWARGIFYATTGQARLREPSKLRESSRTLWSSGPTPWAATTIWTAASKPGPFRPLHP